MSKPTPRLYQLDAVDAAIRTMDAGERALVHLPTGTGKTVVMTLLAEHYAERGPILLVAHMGELLDQATAMLERAGFLVLREQADDRVSPYVVGGYRASFTQPIAVVGSIPTMRGDRLHKWPADFFSLVLVDETHHATAATYRRFLSHWSADTHVCGVTATPQRAGLAKLFTTAYSMSLGAPSLPGSAIGEGWLVPLEMYRLNIIGWDISKLARPKGKNQDITADAAQRFVEEGFLPMVRAIRERIQGMRTVIFVPGVSLARRVAEYLSAYVTPDEAAEYRAAWERAGWSAEHIEDAIERITARIPAVAVSGDTPRERPPGITGELVTRREILDAFEAWSPRQPERGVQALVNDSIFTEGVDLPSIECIVVARLTRSTIRMTQMIGRGARLDRETAHLVNRCETAADRQAVIAFSGKPKCVVYLLSGDGAELDIVTPAHLAAKEWDERPASSQREQYRAILDRLLDDHSEHYRAQLMDMLIRDGLTLQDLRAIEDAGDPVKASDLLEAALEARVKRELDKAKRDAERADLVAAIEAKQAAKRADRAADMADKTEHTIERVVTPAERRAAIVESWEKYQRISIEELERLYPWTTLRVDKQHPLARAINPCFRRWTTKRMPAEPQQRSKAQQAKHDERRIEAGNAMKRYLISKGMPPHRARATAGALWQIASAWTLTQVTRELQYWQVQLGERKPYSPQHHARDYA